MKKGNKVSLGLVSLTTLTGLGVIGATSGTMAWYINSHTTGFSFVGTSVAKSALLSVGIVDDFNKISASSILQYSLVRETVGTHSVVFAQSANGLDYRVIREYLSNSGYTSTMLSPVTTRARSYTALGRNLTLYESPLAGDGAIETEATPRDFVKIPFAFKADDYIGTDVSKNIWLIDADVNATGVDSGKKIDQALRVFVDNGQRGFLFKPADESTNIGQTKVGGLLNLNKGEFYDELDGKEIYYGDYTGTLTYNGPYPIDEEHAELDNVNGMETVVPSTFCAKHEYQVQTVDLTSIAPKVAEYHTLGTVKPSIDPNDRHYYEGSDGKSGIKIASTDSTTGVGYATFTIFIEGWDHAVVDDRHGSQFSLNLRFEMDR